MINTVVDGMIIGHFLGGQAMAAFGLIIPLYSLLSLIPVLLRTATQMQIGMLVGRGDMEGARKTLFVLLSGGVIAAIPFFLLFSLFREPLLQTIGFKVNANIPLLSMASDYLLLFAPALFPIMASPVLHPLMQFDGDGSRSPFAISCGTAVNLAGDILNATVFHGGMSGMALATTISCFVECAVLILHFGRYSVLRPTIGRVKISELSEAFKAGLPMMISEAVTFITGVMLNSMVYHYGGEKTLAALSTGNAIWPFLLSAPIAISSTGLTLGNVSMGEEDYGTVQKIFRMGIWYSLIPGSIFALIFFFFASPLSAFTSTVDTELVGLTGECLRCLAVSLPLVAFCHTVESHLMVLGKKYPATILGIANGGLILVLTARLMHGIYGVEGIWLARPVSAAVLFLIILLFWKITTLSRVNVPGIWETTAYTVQEVIDFSQIVREGCTNEGVSVRIGNLVSLCIEEMAVNIIQWGYRYEINHGVDLRVVYSEGTIFIRFRDNGMRFDPEQYIRQFVVSSDDPTKNYGLRIISGMVEDMKYISLVDCNVVLINIKNLSTLLKVY